MEKVSEVKSIVARTGSDELGLDPMGLNQTDTFITLKPHEDDFVRRCVKAHNSAVDELRSLGKLSPQDDTRYSIEYKDSIVPLQESTDEDATTATYKKTYKFIGTW